MILLFEPEGRRNLIPAIRPVSRQFLFFRRGVLTRQCVSALWAAGKPVVTRYVEDYALAAKGLDVEAAVTSKVTEHVRAALLRLAAKDVVRGPSLCRMLDRSWGRADPEKYAKATLAPCSLYVHVL